MSKKVTSRNFVQAETAHYFTAQLRRAPVNEYHHERAPVGMQNQAVARSNVDVLFSYAVVDVTEEATFSVAPSDEYQVDQVIDENHYVVGVVYPGETLTIRNADLSGGTHVYVLGRTALVGGVERAHRLQDLRRISAATANPYRPGDWDETSRRAVGVRLERRAAGSDLTRAFGTPTSTDPDQHLLGTRVGWGGLPPEHALYYEGTATSSGCDIWTFDVPPVDLDRNGFYSVVKYDDDGRLDVDRPAIAGTEMMRNGDGTISVYFGDDTCIASGNVIRTTAGRRFRYGMRLYRPRDVEEARQYIEGLRSRGLETVLT
ncbi:hypothetical protein [Agromyces sp. ZXT2-6]|uniref:hypothetical protein n=1 Tax=Agromyces sp. ZXT2-6 TaxID=3461153 RepID=UPI0040550D53